MRSVIRISLAGLVSATLAWCDLCSAASDPLAPCLERSKTAGPQSGWHLGWENDSIVGPYGTDQHYTQGMQFGYRFAAGKEPRLLSAIVNPVCGLLAHIGGPSSKLSGAGGLLLGQHFFTPADLRRTDAISEDRPYAAWSYVGARLEVSQQFDKGLLKSRGLSHSLEMQIGTLGHRARGDSVQIRWHRATESVRPSGWQHQLPNHYGVQTRYQVRALVSPAAGWSLRKVSHQLTLDGGIALGTIQRNSELGATWRIGRNLGDPITSGMRPSAIEFLPKASDGPPDCIRKIGLRECYVFISVLDRGVQHNEFLLSAPSGAGDLIEKKDFVHEITWGARARWDRIQIEYTSTMRSREFSPVPASAANRKGKAGFGAIYLRCFAPMNAGDGRWDLACPWLLSTLVTTIAVQ